ncbi:hypothetical protein [Pseudomonas sp. GM74]|uniref:hypothetical protein n=1 Tax=Pseudomonas sp. GM74 TaxID=1144336 RepID=UPI0012FA8DF8|nr:hypothetical protein [Pseudomonas sp. GM74]
MNKNIDKRYCFQNLGTPTSLAETRVATPLNRFWSYAEKKIAISLNFCLQTRPTAKIAYHEDLRKYAKTSPLDVFDQAVGRFSIAYANQIAKDHAALIALKNQGVSMISALPVFSRPHRWSSGRWRCSGN